MAKNRLRTSPCCTRYNRGRVNKGDMLSMEDVLEILRIKLVGVIGRSIRTARIERGELVILDATADAGKTMQIP